MKRLIAGIALALAFALPAASADAATTRQWNAWWAIDRICGDFSGGQCDHTVSPDGIVLYDCYTNYRCWEMGYTHREKHWWEFTWNGKGSRGHIYKPTDQVSWIQEIG